MPTKVYKPTTPGRRGMSVMDYSVLSKVVLSFAMLLGRLEIYPLVLTLLPATWTKK